MVVRLTSGDHIATERHQRLIVFKKTESSVTTP
jgi:hypothetical protein